MQTGNPSSSFMDARLTHCGIGLTNVVHSEVAPILPLPSLPLFCGALNSELELFEERGCGSASSSSSNNSRSLNRGEILAQSRRIAELLRETDVSYLNLRGYSRGQSQGHLEPFELYDQVLQCNPKAFDLSGPASNRDFRNRGVEKKPDEPNPPAVNQFPTVPFVNQLQSVPVVNELQKDGAVTNDFRHNSLVSSESTPSRKVKVKKKSRNDPPLPELDLAMVQETVIRNFNDMLEDFCGRAEVPGDDTYETEWLSLSVDDLKILVNEVISIRTKKLLHMVPVDILSRVLRVLDHQIHRAEGLTIDESDHPDSGVVSLVLGALESIYASLLIMAQDQMPKQLYKDEIIERILEFSRHQMMVVMSVYDPTYRASHKSCENVAVEGEEDEELDADLGSANKKRRTMKSAKVKKLAANKISRAVNTIVQKLCTILALLRDLLLVERLSDSCLLQLLRTSFTTFLVENIQLLQLQAISLISGIYYAYAEHRTYVIDEICQLLWKLPSSKRALRTYYLPDEEQRQIQMVTALLIQLVHSSANPPESLRQASSGNRVPEVTVDACYPSKCHETVTETCCLFWTRVLQRFTTVKSHDASEVKAIIENLVTDLLTTLNLPEYPASAPLLEVFCVLLLNNAGLHSKDTSARLMAIELLGIIATRLKYDAVLCSKDKFWILQERECDNGADQVQLKACYVCLERKSELSTCQSCQRLFHVDCVGLKELEFQNRYWHCPFCICKRQLLVLQSYCNSDSKNDGKSIKSVPGEADWISKLEIVQQILLNYLQDNASSEDVRIFICWFYLCLWYKDDPKAQQNFNYYIAKLRAKAIVRDTGTAPLLLARDLIKKMILVLGQDTSFSRGFNSILHLLLCSLIENSPTIRAKALKAVTSIVEADPEVLRDKRVQVALEGRFCDSAISVRETALELVGKHIASHPDVGLQYFDKVAERIKDTGVSVRKRAIKIIRDMCTSNPNFPEFTRACVEIISRVSDDESSIQDLVCRTFYEFWFEEPYGPQAQFYGDGSSVPLEMAKKTEQMVELLRRMPSHQHLITVIRRNLALDFFPQSAKAAGINPVALASVRKRCELICQCLLERILQVEETNGEEGEVHVLSYMLVLNAFCVVDPSLCAPASDSTKFVITLQPYLKNQVDSKNGAKLLESIIVIINSVLPLIRKLPNNVAEELVQDLKHMIARHSFLTVVHACIRCLCSVSKVAGKGASVIEYLLQLFFKTLHALGPDNKEQAVRSLCCLGLLIRYGNSLLSASSGRSFNIAGCLNLFQKYLHMEDFSIKVRALQALGFVLIARPEYMLQRDIGKIIEATLSSESDARLKMQALKNMHEYLLDAEGQMRTEKASDNAVNNASESDHSVPVAAGAGDTNICGGIVQLYWDSILNRCLDLNDEVRQTGLKIVEIVLRQGLVHPITCVPFLIALETDPHEANQKLAHRLLINMNEKYPSFFESRLGDGLQMSFHFVQAVSRSSQNSKLISQRKGHENVNGKTDSNALTQARLGVCQIYKLIRGNRVSRNKFMSSIVRKFDSPTWNESVVPFLMYCTETLALLPFTSPDEPLYLVYSINRIIQVKAGVIEANLKALLQRDLARSGQENGTAPGEPLQPISGPTAMMDLNFRFIEGQPWQSFGQMGSLDLNGAVKHDLHNQFGSFYTPMPASDVRKLSVGSSRISVDDMEKTQVDCLAATALQLLLRLKRHLKIVYSLDDARCQEFCPTKALNSKDVLTRQNIPFDIGEICTDPPSTYQDLVQHYQEFKAALKEDAIDYSVYSASVKRKRPTRKNSRSARTINRDNVVEEEEDNDQDYGSSAQRLNFSVRKSYNTRGR